jgi:glutathione S-transferase
MLAPPELKQIHPLGKSPVVEVIPPGSSTPIVLAESAAITEYFCDYYGKWLVPTRYREGKDGQVGCETESWLRYRMLMHYAEGSLMPNLLMALMVKSTYQTCRKVAETGAYNTRNKELSSPLLYQAGHKWGCKHDRIVFPEAELQNPL